MKWWQHLVHEIASTRPGAWLFSHAAHRVDRVFIQRSGGRRSLTSALSGLPVVTLTATGAKSGRPRSVPLVGIEDGERVVLIASNFGRAHHPAWYHNLRANPEATLSVRGHTRSYVAREANDAEREDYWRQAVELYVGYGAYKKRTGGRRIPIMVLTPKATHERFTLKNESGQRQPLNR
jgi:deazaflavin-dependent oxidoreductase (nitroreductase family)